MIFIREYEYKRVGIFNLLVGTFGSRLREATTGYLLMKYLNRN